MRGGSQAVFVQCDDGKYYILKLAGNPQGPNVLANEWIGAVLIDSAGLPVARPQFIGVSPLFLSANPDMAFESPSGARQAASGLHLGSMLVGEVAGPNCSIQYLKRSAIDRVANRAAFLGMYLFDLWAMQRDSRQAIFRARGATLVLDAVFIDHSHLLGGPNWNLPERKLLACHYEMALYSGLWSDRAVTSWIEVFRRKIPDVLSSAFAVIPEHWYSGDLSAVQASLLTRLDNIHQLVEQRSTLDGFCARREDLAALVEEKTFRGDGQEV